VSILPDLPLTAVGKIYKPALRVLATMRAVEYALISAGLIREEFDVAASETETIISVRNEKCQEAAKRALIGMPVHYEVRISSPRSK
jgi:fatty-acyl-CoA synthase